LRAERTTILDEPDDNGDGNGDDCGDIPPTVPIVDNDDTLGSTSGLGVFGTDDVVVVAGNVLLLLDGTMVGADDVEIVIDGGVGTGGLASDDVVAMVVVVDGAVVVSRSSSQLRSSRTGIPLGVGATVAVTRDNKAFLRSSSCSNK
jgi:hypothetical protein